ncbi:hypothetical protein EVAR_75357_1 [Eumeta japonica]|uniref:Uncharacterized protein n=1 Tax=Eumeta variegata TaxID=151549 RepID=A0A4C1Y9X1_EUMVA|nr:hypothetical protein EVAR_75357_1 [Eumeta japonica]
MYMAAVPAEVDAEGREAIQFSPRPPQWCWGARAPGACPVDLYGRGFLLWLSLTSRIRQRQMQGGDGRRKKIITELRYRPASSPVGTPTRAPAHVERRRRGPATFQTVISFDVTINVTGAVGARPPAASAGALYI